MLKIKRDSVVYLEENPLNFTELGDANSVILSFLNLPTELEEGITMSELIHTFYNVKKFISDYFAEEYEVARALTTVANLEKKCTSISFYKTFNLELDSISLEDEEDDEFVYIMTEAKFIVSENEEEGFLLIGDLPIVLDNKLSYYDEEFSFDKKVKFTLLDILTCLFEDAVHLVRTGSNIKA